MKNISDALLIVDLQNGVCVNGDNKIYRLDSLIALVNSLIVKYHKNNLPIIFVQHSDEELIKKSSEWEIFTGLLDVPNAFYVEKTHANSFYKTNLNRLLSDLSISSIEICGAQSQFCIDTTIKVAHSLGYELAMKKGATTTYNNRFMSAEDTVNFYEDIWNKRFLTLYN